MSSAAARGIDSGAGSGADGAGPGLEADRELLGRTSTAARVAGILRTRIADGYFEPGVRLSEDSIGSALGVSRNTLREAFRLLTHERLLIHELNRGVFVRVLSAEDVVDLYQVRRVIECAAVRNVTDRSAGLAEAATAVAEGQRALDREAWSDLGTANIRFHQAITRLLDSQRVDEIMRGILAELRLVFYVMNDPRRFHEPYLNRNREILERLQAGEGTAAERLLAVYLDDSERQLVDAYREREASAQP